MHVDLAQWIRFGRVARGSGEPEYVDLLDALRLSVQKRQVRVVLSGAQYREISKIKDPSQRRALANIVEEITDFTYITSHVDIVRLELQASLDALTRTTGIPWGGVELLGSSRP